MTLKTVKRKDTDLPWLNNRARKLIKKKCAIFKSEGYSDRWHGAKKKVDDYLEQRRTAFLSSQRDKLTGPTATANFFKNMKAFSTAEKPKSFDVRNLRPGVNDSDIADEVAAYFNRISSEFQPLEPHQIPATYDRELAPLSLEEVSKMIKTAKKSSMVRGDIFPKLVTKCTSALAVPLQDIYNCILRTFIWPLHWKREFVTTIPKKTAPESLSDLRNISCTLLFSKIFEKHVLKLSMEEISLKRNQFGGMKGCSTTHMVIEVIQEMCENAEDYRSATVLTAVDFAKAFNRVSYQHCLEAFRKKGASTTVIRLLASFLMNRTMTVRVGQEWSEPLPVDGGCPQGSILGVWLFNVTTDDLEDKFLEHDRRRLQGNDPVDVRQEDQPPEPAGRVAGPDPVTSSPSGAESKSLPDLSPIHNLTYRLNDRNIEFRPNVANLPVPAPILVDPPVEEPTGTQVLVLKLVKILKYVDDCLAVEKLNFGATASTHTALGPIKTKQAFCSTNAFLSVKTTAEERGMIVNENKTQVLCISDALSYTPETFILDSNGQKISSQKSLKLLGFNFSNRPTVEHHVSLTVTKIRQRTWALRHLAKVGFSSEELVKVYQCSILPLADYCAPAYHSMLTDEQDQLLERAQIAALRSIYGY